MDVRRKLVLADYHIRCLDRPLVSCQKRINILGGRHEVGIRRIRNRRRLVVEDVLDDFEDQRVVQRIANLNLGDADGKIRLVNLGRGE